jgi:hypothetical protein
MKVVTIKVIPMNLEPLTTCPACNGPVHVVASVGRVREYRGVRCELPADLSVPTCANCGALWFDGPTTQRLTASFERQRRAAVFEPVRQHVAKLAAIVVRVNSASVHVLPVPASRGRFDMFEHRSYRLVQKSAASPPLSTAKGDAPQLTDINAF